MGKFNCWFCDFDDCHKTVEPCTEGVSSSSPILNIRVSSGIDRYGFTSNASASAYSPKFRIMNKDLYLGRIEYYTSSRASTSATYYKTSNHWTTRASDYNTTRASDYNTTRASDYSTTRASDYSTTRASDYVDYTYNAEVTGYGTRQDVNYYQTRASTSNTYYRQSILAFCDSMYGLGFYNGATFYMYEISRYNDYFRSYSSTRTSRYSRPSGFNKYQYVSASLTFYNTNNRLSYRKTSGNFTFYNLKIDGGFARCTIDGNFSLDDVDEEVGYGSSAYKCIFCDYSGNRINPMGWFELVSNQATFYETRASTYGTVYKTVTTATYYRTANHWTTRQSGYWTTRQSGYWTTRESWYGTTRESWYGTTRASDYVDYTYNAEITGYGTRSSQYNTQSCNINV